MKPVLSVIIACLLGCCELQAKNLALKNFKEIYRTYQVILNVMPTSQIASRYQSVAEVLPKTGQLHEYTPSMQFGLFELAGEFCRNRVVKDSESPKEKRWLHKEIDFAMIPSQLTQKLQKALVEEYANTLLQRELTPLEEKALLENIIESSKVSASMVDFLTYFCITFLLSPDILTI